MIPKIIHYCWFGRNPKPTSVLNNINTWKKIMPDYTFKEWNEDNFNINYNSFTKEAYKTKKFAFVSDVARLFALYNYGGIYLDTDIIVCKSLTPLLYEKSFMGYEANNLVGTGVIGAEKGCIWIGQFLSLYNNHSFISWKGRLDLQPNTEKMIPLLKQRGCIFDNNEALLDEGIHIYPYEYFCAKNFATGIITRTDITYTIHDYSATWKARKSCSLFNRICNLKIKIL